MHGIECIYNGSYAGINIYAAFFLFSFTVPLSNEEIQIVCGIGQTDRSVGYNLLIFYARLL